MNAEFAWSVGDSRTFSHEFTASDVQRFADLTGDTNPLHVDAAYARKTSAGGQVVHGMLAASFVSTLVGMHIPGRGALWNSFEVAWRKMIRIGDTIEFKVTVTKISAATSTLDLEITGINEKNRELHLQGKARVMALREEPRTEPSVPPTAQRLAGKRFIVTGASGEVGGSICQRLALEGAAIIALGRDAERLKELEGVLGENCEEVRTVDLLDDAGLTSFLAHLSGDLSGVIHAASPPMRGAGAADAENIEHLRAHWRVTVEAFQEIVCAALPLMSNGGSIVSILTQSVYDAPPQKLSAYVASKMALWGLTRSIAAEYGHRGIRCNAVSPSLINTPFTSEVPVRFKQIEEARTPLRRLCSPVDIANAVAFLCGPEGSFLTGVNLPVTGGASMA